MITLRTVTIIALVITVYFVNVESQKNTADKGNPSDIKDIANVNAGNPEAQALIDIQPDLLAKKVDTAKPTRKRPPPRRRRPPPRRRQRKRRPPPSNRQGKGPVVNGNGGGKVTPPEPVVKTQIESKQPEPKLTESAAATLVEAPAVDAGFGQDTFFFLFTETATVAADPDGPPPDFSVNIPPKNKVMPTVDTKNSVAYDGTPCNETFKNHGTDRTQYMMNYGGGVWKPHDCPPNLSTGLVWRQDLCACGEELVAQDPDDWCAQMGFNADIANKHKYVRQHHGVNAVMDCAANLVWSQKNCQCSFDPTVKARPIENKVTFYCKTILQLEFEGNLKNTAQGYHIQTVDLRRRGKLPRIRYRKIPGSTNKAAMIVSQPLEFLAFRGNDFQTKVTYSLSFKISPRHDSRNSYMVLMTDECIGNRGGQNKARKPSISLKFQPNTKSFHLQFRTIKTEIDHIVKGVLSDSYGWYKVVVYLEDKTVTMEANGKKLFTQTDVLGKIPQNKCPLYLAGRGRGFDRSQDFYGYLDNAYLVKDCKFHEANIKFL